MIIRGLIRPLSTISPFLIMYTGPRATQSIFWVAEIPKHVDINPILSDRGTWYVFRSSANTASEVTENEELSFVSQASFRASPDGGEDLTSQSRYQGRVGSRFNMLLFGIPTSFPFRARPRGESRNFQPDGFSCSTKIVVQSASNWEPTDLPTKRRIPIDCSCTMKEVGSGRKQQGRRKSGRCSTPQPRCHAKAPCKQPKTWNLRSAKDKNMPFSDIMTRKRDSLGEVRYARFSSPMSLFRSILHDSCVTVTATNVQVFTVNWKFVYKPFKKPNNLSPSSSSSPSLNSSTTHSHPLNISHLAITPTHHTTTPPHLTMHFSPLLALTLTTLASATPYHGQYDYPHNTTITSSLQMYVYPTSTPTKSAAMGYGYSHGPIVNSTTTADAAEHPTDTAAPSSPSIVPFTGASAPVKGASLALVVVAGVVVGWY